MWMWYVAAVVAAAVTAAIYEVRRILSPLVPVKGETNIPGIIGGITLPLLGDCWRFVGKDMMGVWDALDSIHKKQKVVHAWRGGSLTIVVGEPDMIETVLNSPKTKSKPDDFYGEFNMIADGAFSSNGKRWQTLRVALDKLTHPNYIMANYLWKLEESAKKLCATLDTKCDKGTFELNAIMLDQFVEIIAETVLGIPLNRFKDPKRFREKVATTANKALEVAVSGVLKPYVKIPIIHHFTRYKKLINELQEIIATTGPECFEIRSRILKERGDNVEDPNFIPECYADVVIQQAHIEKTDLRRVWPMFVEMITVSFDTPANVLSSTCLFLAMHPECQKKVYQEQLSIMGKSLEPPTMAEVTEMKYLEMCFKEALRHVAPPGFGRLVESEMKIDDYIFPEGAIVYVSTYTSRKDPTYWAKPMEYHPEHFLPEEVEKRPKGVYLPFSAGSRVCPGKSFAKLANLIILSTLMRRYKFSTHLKFQNIKYKYVVTLEPDTDYLLSITRRGEVNN